MNWNDLKVFLAIAETGTLAAAARRLGQNHSTTFRRLNALEEALDVQLFERLPEGYVATSAGERLVELASQADAAVEKIASELAGRDLKPRGKVRLTAPPNIARSIAVDVVCQLRVSHPDIVVELLSDDSDYNLNRREADIALRATTKPPAYLVGRKLLDLSWWLCRSSASRRTVPRSIGQMAGLPLIGADAALLRLPVFQWLEAEHAESIVARANDLSTMAAMARAGVGYALLPSDQDDSGLKRTLKLDDFVGQLWVLTHPDRRNITRNRVVWDAIVARAVKPH